MNSYCYKWQAILVGILMFSHLLWGQPQGCEDCLFATVDSSSSVATIHAFWLEDGQPSSSNFPWVPGDTITVSCHTDIIPVPDSTFAVTPSGDTLEVSMWTITQSPTYETIYQVTDSPNLAGEVDTVFTSNCQVSLIVYLYTPPNEGFACNEVIPFSGADYMHEMTFPVGSGENITIDFIAYYIPDTLTIIAAGNVVFKEAIGTGNGATLPNNVVWDNGNVTPFTGNSPVHGEGFVRVILDLEDNCDLKVIAQSNSNPYTAWRLYVHCCPDCYEPPVKTAQIDTTICFSGMINNTLVTRDTALSRLDLTRGGCDSITIFNVHVAKPGIDSIVTVDASCFGFADGAATAFVTAEIPTYRWSNQTNQAVNTGLSAGPYELTVTDRYGCMATSMTTINEPPLLEGIMSFVEPRCYGEQNGKLGILSIGGSPPYNQLWSNGSTQLQIDSLFTGEYAVTISDSHECVEVIPFFLDQPDTLIANIGFNDPTCLGIPDGEVWADTQGGTLPYVYQWSTQESSAALYDLLTGLYTLTVTDSHGCIDEAAHNLRFQQPDETYLPTAFSPNFDLVNDRFLPFSGKCVVQIISFKVFDRWGDQLFDNRDFQPNEEYEGWDGRFREAEVQAGNYIWYLEVEYYSGKREVLKGEVMVMR